jgi:putative peptidoglycan lipid II flippase
LTQLRHRFILYSISPLLYNLGIIFGATVLYPMFGIAGLGLGVIFGATMHMAVQLPFFIAEKSTGSLSLTRMRKGLSEVLSLSIPRTLALASTQISLVALTALASFLVSGSITIFTFAYNLQSVPLTIIGVSYAVAAFPTLSRLHARGALEEFLQYIEAALRHIIFWSIPATIFMIVMRAQIVRVILGSGEFNWDDTRLTAAALALFVLSLAAQSITLLIARAYYAIGNTKKPLYYGCADIVVSIGSALLLLFVFKNNQFMRAFIEALLRVQDVPGTAVLMLALGYALGSIAEGIVSYYYFVHDFAISRARIARLFFESFAASTIGAGVTYLILSETGTAGTVNTTIGLVAQSILAGGVGLAVAAATLHLLKNQELGEALTALHRKFTAARTIAVEPSDVS